MARLTEEIVLDGGVRVVARELLVSEIRAYLADYGQFGEHDDAVALELFGGGGEGITFRDLMSMTDLNHDAINALAPSELEAVIAACKKVNARFFQMLGRLLRPAGLAPSKSSPASMPA